MWFLKINSWVNSDLERKGERHFERNIIVNGDSKNNPGMIQRRQE
jgi:hypothetical protein